MSAEPLLAVEEREPAPEEAGPQRTRTVSRRVVVAVAVAAAIVIGAVWWSNRGPTNEAIANSSPITEAELEAHYGVKLGVVGLLASGGLVELSFQVVDADKATALFGEPEDMPLLAVEGTSTVLESAKGMKHELTLLDGASYFILYGNAGNALHEGSSVAFVMNGERVPHLTVRR